jgi:hypothetical protein
VNGGRTELLDLAYALAVDAVATEAFDALEEVGARPLLLKGRSIARLFGDDPQSRPSLDVDVLVDPASEREASRALSRLGYRVPSPDATRGLSGGEALTRGDGNPPVDLHTRLPFVEVEPAEAFELLFVRSGKPADGAVRLRELDPAAVALHLVLHATLNGPREERTMAELRRACGSLSRELWAETVQLAGRLDALDGLAAGLAMVAEGRVLADELSVPPSRSLIAQLCARGMPDLGPGLLLVHETTGGRARVRQAAEILLPSAERQRARWSLARRGRAGLLASYVLWPLYLVVNTPRLIVRVSRSALAVRRARSAEAG